MRYKSYENLEEPLRLLRIGNWKPVLIHFPENDL